MSGGLSVDTNIGELAVPVSSVFPQVAGTTTSTITGAAIDRLAHGDVQSAILHLAVGANGGPVSVQATILHSSVSATTGFVAFAPSEQGYAGTTAQTPAATTANVDEVLNVDLRGANRWVEVQVAVGAGMTTTFAAPVVAAELVLGGEAEIQAI